MSWWRRRDTPETCDSVARDPAPLPAAFAELLRNPRDRYYARPPLLVPWPHPFRPFQVQGITALLERPALLLADDMGLGKTVQAIGALRVLVRGREVDDALIIVPATLLAQWSTAFRAWAPELRLSIVRGSASDRAWQWRTAAHVYIVGYETLRSDFTDNPHSPPRSRRWGVVVLDEAQRIRNRESELARICKRVPRRRAWALTGTPLENRLDDLASICEFLTPADNDTAPIRLYPDAELLRLHAHLQLRRRKADVLPELPPKIIIDLPLALTPTQRAAYDLAQREGVHWLRSLGRTVTVTNVLTLIMRLKQICNIDPASNSSSKLDDLEARIETLAEAGHKTLVFSQFVDDNGIAAILRRLRQLDPLAYTGLQSQEERGAAARRFRDDAGARLMVVSLRAGGVGLNLPQASYVFHYDRWWNPAVEKQAEDRAHRMGRTEPVVVYRYIAEDTIEQRIDALLAQKQALFDAVVDPVSIDLERSLSAPELFGLFGLEPPG